MTNRRSRRKASKSSSNQKFYRECSELARQVQLSAERVFELLRKSVPPLLTPHTSLQTEDWTSLSFQAPVSSNTVVLLPTKTGHLN
jgi:hypothetical protein